MTYPWGLYHPPPKPPGVAVLVDLPIAELLKETMMVGSEPVLEVWDVGFEGGHGYYDDQEQRLDFSSLSPKPRKKFLGLP